MKNIKKTLRQNILTGRGLNPGLSEYEAGILHIYDSDLRQGGYYSRHC